MTSINIEYILYFLFALALNREQRQNFEQTSKRINMIIEKLDNTLNQIAIN